MKNELMLDGDFTSEIQVEQGSIKFDSTRLKAEAEQIASYVSSIEVTDDTVKESKKLVAKLSKAVKSLEDERIRIKNQILEPYTYFERDVKEIVGIVKEADEIVRVQIRELDEQERDRKHEQLLSIWNKRIEHYSFRDTLSASDFIKPQHLNKTTSISKTEQEIVEYLERIQSDLKTVQLLDNNEDVLEVYLDTLDVSRAIQIVQERKQKQERATELQTQLKPVPEKVKDDTFVFRITGKKDRKLVEILLRENEIEFEVIEG